MMALLPPGVLLPFVLALLPAALPPAVAARRLAATAACCSVLTMLVAACCAVPNGLDWLNGSTGWWRNDRLARTMVMLPALGWMLVSFRALQPGEAARAVSDRWRRWPVTGQLATASAMALFRADLLALIPPLLGSLLLLAHRDDPTGRQRAFVLSALPLMAVGVMLLSNAIGAPARWALLAPAAMSGRTQATGLVLLLLPLLLLSVSATLRPALAGRPGILRGLSRMLVSPVALVVALRCCAAAPLEPLVLVFGIGAIAMSLLLLPACRDLPARLALAVGFQNGVMLLAVAAGGPGGVAAAVMLAGCLSLLLPLALWYPVDAASVRLRMVAIAVMVGLPPFGPFAAGMVLLVRLSGTAPASAIVLLVAAALSAVSVLEACARETGAASGARITGWLACVVVVLLAVLWAGLAMPVAVSDWFLLIGGKRS